MTGKPVDALAGGPEAGAALVLRLEATEIATHAWLRAAGELDQFTATALLGELMGLAKRRCRHVDLDLRQVSFCDGSGFATLLEGGRRIARHGGTVLLHDPCPSLQALLDVCNLMPALQPRPPSLQATAGPAE